MNSRERVRALLDHRPVDRIPNGLGGCETAGLHSAAYARLKEVLGVADGRNRLCTFMCNAVFEPSVLAALEGDVILLGSQMCPARLWGPGAEDDWKELTLWNTPLQVPKEWDFQREPDGSWIWNLWGRRICRTGSFYFDTLPEPDASLAEKASPKPADFKPSHEFPEKLLRSLEDQARFLFENTGYSILCGEMIQDLQLQPAGTTAWWMRMVEEPEACHEFLGRACDAALAQLTQLDQAIGRYCDMLQIAHDFGDTRGVTIGPELWRGIYKPHYQRLFQGWHRRTRMKVSLHSCGAIREILPDLIECGADVYNPVQLSARGMDPVMLKELAGNRLIFYGGALDAVQLPPQTPEAEVYAAVRKNIAALSKGGGFLLAGVHNLPGDLPASHLRALLQAWRDCRADAELTGQNSPQRRGGAEERNGLKTDEKAKR